MAILNSIFYTALTLGILIFIHELGHFLAAKLTGMRVDRFSIGFPPRAFGKKIGDTDYCVSWIPIGGYVKIAGMIDESFDTDFIHREPQSYEFRAKPFWAKMFVISAGVIMNLLIAFMIFWTIQLIQGNYVKEVTEVSYVISGSTAEKSGILPGDKIISINGNPITHWDEINQLIYIKNLNENISMQIERNGEYINLTIPRTNIPELINEPFGIINAYEPVTITSVESGMPAEKLGLKPGDIIVSINDQLIGTSEQVVKIIREFSNRELFIKWKRENIEHSGTVLVTEKGRIGIAIENIYTGPIKKINYTLFESFYEAGKSVVQFTIVFFHAIRRIITGDISFRESFGGPIKIAQFATKSAEYGLMTYLGFMAILSMSLAILNILPIPALDGGHLLILSIERIFNREIPHKIKLGIQQAGFIILITFMAFVIYNDIVSF